MLGRDLRAQALHGDIPQQQREARTLFLRDSVFRPEAPSADADPYKLSKSAGLWQARVAGHVPVGHGNRQANVLLTERRECLSAGGC